MDEITNNFYHQQSVVEAVVEVRVHLDVRQPLLVLCVAALEATLVLDKGRTEFSIFFNESVP